MLDKTHKLLHQLVPDACIQEIDSWIAKYPPDQKQSAVMSALLIVQDALGYLAPETMDAVAEYLDMPAISVYEVASFYSMYERKPVGRHVISVCTNISCKLRHADVIVDALEKKLNIKVGETTEDTRFTLRTVECLGACVHAPMMQVDKNYHEHLTPDTLDVVLDEYL